MKVVVFGATGVLGRQVLPRLVERGHSVRAVLKVEGVHKAVAGSRDAHADTAVVGAILRDLPTATA